MPIRNKNKMLLRFRIEEDQIYGNNNSHKNPCIKVMTFRMGLKN